MSENDFYLTLPSSASLDLHPDNTLTHYITTLPQRVSLSGQWECGLVEIQYPHTWYNVRKENSWFAIVNGSEGSYDIDKGNIEVGYYDRPERLITAINKSLKVASDKKNVTLSYSKITQKVTVDLDPGMMLSMDMSNILGFNKFLIRTAREGDSVVDMAQGFFTRCTSTLTSWNHVSLDIALCRC